ncbi:TPA: hypothetical protein HA278_07245 [Candidatus Woesearchaeota archaeon]|nr:hypothetical protein [archaeon]HIJ11828.1 hypothetical protein [Candidatus Woesearchaeota archaeon]
MAEKHLVIDHLKFSYEGLFNATEFYDLIVDWFYEKGWDWYEKVNQEQVTPDGKHIRLVLEPWKSSSDFYKLKMKIHLQLLNVREVEVEHEGKTLRLNHGVIRMVFDGFVMSDRTGEWTSKPFWWFFTVVAEKYFFKHHYKKFVEWIKSDVEELHTKIKEYLNVFKYTYRT